MRRLAKNTHMKLPLKSDLFADGIKVMTVLSDINA
jgi:hypothetical protein